MSFDNYQVPLSALSNADSFRVYVNRIFEQLVAGQAGYANALPPIADQIDGRLFVNTSTNKLYQARSGAWVALT